MTTQRGLACGWLVAFLVSSSPAWALEGDWTALRAQVEADRKAHPAAHRAFAAVVERFKARPPTRERSGRVSRELRALDKGALFPALAMLSYDDGKLAGLPASTRVPLTAALLEAVRVAQDARAFPVLRALLDGPETDVLVARTAAETEGALCSDEAVDHLLAHAVDGDRRELEATAGLGWCRKERTGRALVARLSAVSSEEQVLVAQQALGWWGSSWAWATLDRQARDHGAAARAEVMRALVSSFLGGKGAVRLGAQRALLMLEHPETASLLKEQARGADEETRLAADKLVDKLTRARARGAR